MIVHRDYIASIFKENLKKIKEKGLIKRIGSDRKGQWVVMGIVK